MPPGTPDEVQPPAEPVDEHGPVHHGTLHPDVQPQWHAPVAPGAVNWHSGRRAALFAGLLAGMGTFIPVMPFILLCMLAAGGLSIAFYTRREPAAHLPASSGMKLGALAGVFGFLLNACLSSLALFSAQSRAALRTELMGRLKETLESASDQAARDALQRLGDMLATPGGLALFFILAISVFGVLFVALAGLGGAVGASLFGRQSSPES